MLQFCFKCPRVFCYYHVSSDGLIYNRLIEYKKINTMPELSLMSFPQILQPAAF